MTEATPESRDDRGYGPSQGYRPTLMRARMLFYNMLQRRFFSSNHFDKQPGFGSPGIGFLYISMY